jgi:hypothetical protein
MSAKPGPTASKVAGERVLLPAAGPRGSAWAPRLHVRRCRGARRSGGARPSCVLDLLRKRLAVSTTQKLQAQRLSAPPPPAAPSRSRQVPYNYAATTASATQVAGAARPGAKFQRCFSDCKEAPVAAEEVAAWVKAMKAHGVAAVVSLLSPAEVATYAPPGVEAAMREAFGPTGYSVFNLKDEGGRAPAGGGQGGGDIAQGS